LNSILLLETILFILRTTYMNDQQFGHIQTKYISICKHHSKSERKVILF